MSRTYLSEVSQTSLSSMIAAFLLNNRHQITESEVSDYLIIDQPDINNPVENKERWIIFKNKFWLFSRFLPPCDWFECQIIAPQCFQFIEIINEVSWFHDVPATNRLVTNLSFISTEQQKHKAKIDTLIEHGIENFINQKTLILIGKYDSDKLSLIDGNHRFAAIYKALEASESVQFSLNAIIGLTYGNCRWMGDTDIWEERPSLREEKRYVLNIW